LLCALVSSTFLLSSYIMYLQVVFGLVFDERNMIGSKWDGHQLAIADSTHRPVPA
jgi:hypothetical protein